MFSNEVIISKSDKIKILNYIKQINEILDKYPYDNDSQAHTITNMSRAKCAAHEAEKWISYLYTPKDEVRIYD